MFTLIVHTVCCCVGGGFIDYFQDVRFRLSLQVHLNSASTASTSQSFFSLPENMIEDNSFLTDLSV